MPYCAAMIISTELQGEHCYENWNTTTTCWTKQGICRSCQNHKLLVFHNQCKCYRIQHFSTTDMVHRKAAKQTAGV